MVEVDTYQHAGLTIRIWAEEYIEEWMNPRREDDFLLGVMFCEHSRYDLGDTDAPDPRDQTMPCPVCKGTGEHLFEVRIRRPYGYDLVRDGFASQDAAEEYAEQNEPADERFVVEPSDCTNCDGSGEVDVSMIEYLKREHGARVILPLFLYDHSGITMRAGGRLDMGEDSFDRRGRFMGDDAGWDTSSVGVIFDTAESRKRCGWEERSDEEIEADLRAEVELYAAFLEGQVYGYDILRARKAREDEDAIFYVDPETGEEIDDLDDAEVLESCGGFLDPDIVFEDKSDTIIEAKRVAEACVSHLEHERAEAHRWACADVITIEGV